MKIISPKIHAVLDYVVATFLMAAPFVLDLSALASYFSIVLGAVHFILTLLTIFKGGALKIITFPIHGIIELLVSLILAVLAFTLFRTSKIDHFYYACLAITIFMIYVLTDYNSKKP